MGTTGWVAVLEAQPTDGERAVGISDLRRVLEHMPGGDPIALHSAERVAVQVHVEATGELEALSLASAGLRSGLATVGLWGLRVVRAEVLTREEFERDCRLAGGEGSATASLEVGRAGADHCRAATIRRARRSRIR